MPRLCRDCDTPCERYQQRCPKHQAEVAAAKWARFVEYRAESRSRGNRSQQRATRRARLAGARTVERIDPATIFQRDGFRCQLCGKRLAMKAKAPHPNAPTLDHIVPLAQGGGHEACNIQSAHFLCNSRKSNLVANDQLLLFG